MDQLELEGDGVWIDGEWVLWDRGCWKDGRCAHCGEERTERGHDPCIANLPGVWSACCGHGVVTPFLVELVYGEAVSGEGACYGEAALKRLRELGGDPPSTWKTSGGET
jgi:hypothetical protein